MFTLYNAAGQIVDAVLVTDDPARTTSAVASETQASAVAAASQWQNVGGGTPPGGYVDADFNANAVPDLNGTGTSAAGDTIQRLDNTDDHDEADWTVNNAAQSWGLPNAGQTPF